jgi:nitroreductase
MATKAALSAELGAIALPEPDFGRDMSVREALERRRTTREISDRKLSLRLLSNLLWAACGTNREKGPFGVQGITAGSASNAQEIRVYVALEKGLFLYDPRLRTLLPVAAGDHRKLAIGKGQASFGSEAPARLIYVADVDRFAEAGFQEPGLRDPETQKAYYFVDAGLAAGNVYLAAAALGLGAWFHNCDKPGLSKLLGLGSGQRPLFGQTIGYRRRGNPGDIDPSSARRYSSKKDQ